MCKLNPRKANANMDMDLLIIRSLTGRTTAEEDDRLRAWRAADPANERYYRSIGQLWTLSSAAMPELSSVDMPDPEALLEQAERAPDAPAAPQTVPAGPSGSSRRSVRATWLPFVIPVALAASFGAVGFGLGVIRDADRGQANWLGESEIVTGSGELTTLTLHDGTSVRLGPRSRLRLGTEPREVWLEGRAFFGVAADSSRIFTVRTGHGDAVVLGTRFEVRSEEDEFRVLVVEGHVSVSAAGTTVDVTEGQMSRSRGGGAPSTTRVSNVLDHLSWMGSALVFQSTPLRAAVDEIQRRYGVSVSIETPSLSEVAVTATFTDQSVGEIMSVLCEIVGADCLVDEHEIRIRGRPPLSRSRSPSGPGNRDPTDSSDRTTVRAPS